MTAAAVMSFDTHTFYNRLKNVGFSEQHAEAIAKIQKETELKIELVRKDIEVVRAELKRDISDTKAELSRLILSVGVGMGLAQLLAIFLLFMRMTGKV